MTTRPSADEPVGPHVPLVDLDAQHAEVRDAVEIGWRRVFDQGLFVLGPEVDKFERAFADFCSVDYCVGVGNGTDALALALRALDIRAHDEVILPANTFIACALAVVHAGGTPVLVDVCPETLLISPERVEEAITPRTRAVMAVHLFGQMAPMTELHAIAARHALTIIEDFAQAHGATQHGQIAGSCSTVAATSFYPTKNLGAYGDGGAVVTSDESIARRLRALRNYGSEVKYRHPVIGFNSRLDTLQAAALAAKLPYLNGWNERRRLAADRYQTLFAEFEITLPRTVPDSEHVWHLYVVRVPDRDQVLADLNDRGIGAGVHYPVPIHLQDAFIGLGHRPGSFPVVERAATEMLSLPLFPGITPAQQVRVADELAAALGSSQR